MAKPETRAAWGIDIGQAGLKALRLKYVESAGQVMAVAFDYVPHAKILSQVDVTPEQKVEMIDSALKTFLSRNQVRGDVVAISVPGEKALARFIQLPPVEASKVGEIVKYEARQQIPFALEEVIWDYQPLGAGMEESGFLLDAEVGLFAMKRDQVLERLFPFTAAKVEVDLIQIAPMALYNYLIHDVMGQPIGESNEEDEYSMLLDMGADSTQLVVSNGKKLWIRNVGKGGSHFTRTLTKELKLTFAKAEHLKCNATKAPDPKAIFQALRGEFKDFAGELQRSIGHFSSVNRNAKIKKIYGLGGGFKLAGLQKYLQQELQMEVERIEAFPALVGDSVLAAPLFQENLLSFAVPYGLALQGLNVTRVHTSLLPPEIRTARLVRAKKPWAIAAAALLLVGLGISNAVDAKAVYSVSEDRFGQSDDKAKKVTDDAAAQKSAYDATVAENGKLKQQGEDILKHAEGRLHWLEVYKAINECLPRSVGEQKTIEDPRLKNQIRLSKITCTREADLAAWYGKVDNPQGRGMLKEDQKAPTGAGYVFTLEGRHFHHDPQQPEMQRLNYVFNTLLQNLKAWTITQPGTNVEVPVRKLGITHAYLSFWEETQRTYVPPGKQIGSFGAAANPAAAGNSPMPGSPMPGVVGQPATAGAEEQQALNQTTFHIQFVWKETPEKDRPAVDPIVAAAAAANPGAAPGAALPGATAPGVQTPPLAMPPGPAPAGASVNLPAMPPTGPMPGASLPAGLPATPAVAPATATPPAVAPAAPAGPVAPAGAAAPAGPTAPMVPPVAPVAPK